MKKFKTIEEWLKTNPSEKEMEKVLNLIHRGETNRARKEVYEKEAYLRKLKRTGDYLVKIDFPIPKEIAQEIKRTKTEIESLKKDLPIPAARAKVEK